MVFGHFKERGRRPEKLLRLRCCLDSGSIVVGVDARLQLADPIPAFGKRQTWITLQMIFKLVLVEPFIIEGAEFWRQAAQSPDQPELRGDNVDNETKPRLPREVESIFGFALRIAERISRC